MLDIVATQQLVQEDLVEAFTIDLEEGKYLTQKLLPPVYPNYQRI